ncbi:hypothetical protein PM082_021779 [Marasmius tenuissimus]|nr:hypothetical protein PM082_021779 [Marasmius tenuissimus]
MNNSWSVVDRSNGEAKKHFLQRTGQFCWPQLLHLPLLSVLALQLPLCWMFEMLENILRSGLKAES